MYFETGTTGDAGILTISQGIGIGSRTYDIKATYYTCNSLAKYGWTLQIDFLFNEDDNND